MNINEILAVKVMGWHIKNIAYNWWFNNNDNNPVINRDNWHPDTSIEQALMCAEKLVKSSPLITGYELFYGDDERYLFLIDGLNNEIIAKGYGGNRELIICEAIKEAVENE